MAGNVTKLDVIHGGGEPAPKHIRLRCRFGWHDWAHWEFYRSKNVYPSLEERGTNALPIAQFQVFRRRCLGCGLVELRREQES